MRKLGERPGWGVRETFAELALCFERFGMRWYHRYELEHLLARAGFEVTSLYGDFDRRPFLATSPEMIFVSRPA